MYLEHQDSFILEVGSDGVFYPTNQDKGAERDITTEFEGHRAEGESQRGCGDSFALPTFLLREEFDRILLWEVRRGLSLSSFFGVFQQLNRGHDKNLMEP